MSWLIKWGSVWNGVHGVWVYNQALAKRYPSREAAEAELRQIAGSGYRIVRLKQSKRSLLVETAVKYVNSMASWNDLKQAVVAYECR